MQTIHGSGTNGTIGIGFAVSGIEKEKEEGKNSQLKNGTVFAGNLNNMTADRIEQKREQARKQAAKMVMDQFGRDNEITGGLNELRARNDAIRKEQSGLNDQIDYFKQEQEALKERYGITDDSQEQKDLELLRRANNAFKAGGGAALEQGFSKEELEQVAAMGEPTEYQQRALAYDKIIKSLDDQKEELEKERRSNTSAVVETKRELVKNTGMIKAGDAAQDILDSASDEIRGMMWEDAKKHMDEEMEKLVEAAKEAAEKKEEQEEKLEAAKEKKEEQKELVETIQDGISDQEKLQSEIEKIMKEAELLKEDMKGLVVDGTM